MKKSCFCVISLLIIFLLGQKVAAQEPSGGRKFSIFMGVGTEVTDRRIDFVRPFDKLYALEDIKSDQAPFEYDYFIGSDYAFIQKPKWSIKSGLSYLLHTNYFALPVSKDYFVSIIHPGLNRKYYNHQASINASFDYHIEKVVRGKLSTSISANSNFSFYKNIETEFDFRLKYWGVEPSISEVFMGFMYDFGQIVFYCQARALKLEFLDRALVNHGQSIDFYNPLKIRLNFAYRI